MLGIQQMFAEFSQPDDFHVQAQLELFAWGRRQARAQWKRDNRHRARRHARDSMARRYARDAVYRERKKAEAKARYQVLRLDPAYREKMRQHAKRQHERKQQARAA